MTDKREVFDSCHSEDGLRIIKDIKLGKQCIFGISKRGFETEAFWNIVDKKGDCVLLVSDSPLYTDMAFDYSKGKLYKTWKDTDLRKWINKCYDPGCTVEYCARTGQRYDTDGKQSIVFSKTEKKLIMETELDTNGEKTVDKFFLLSEDEYKKYRELLGDSFYGWLRSYRKGEDLKISHGCVERFSKKYSEEINYKPAYDEKHGYNKYGVYPAVWIDLSNL